MAYWVSYRSPAYLRAIGSATEPGNVDTQEVSRVAADRYASSSRHIPLHARAQVSGLEVCRFRCARSLTRVHCRRTFPAVADPNATSSTTFLNRGPITSVWLRRRAHDRAKVQRPPRRVTGYLRRAASALVSSRPLAATRPNTIFTSTQDQDFIVHTKC
ncbi:unnamed protein product, partial [Brenthis ino]